MTMSVSVCPRCGSAAEPPNRYCGVCGLDLGSQYQLPMRENWLAQRGSRSTAPVAPPPAATGGLVAPSGGRIEEAASALPHPATVRARQATRLRLLGGAAAAVTVAFALSWVGTILVFVRNLEEVAPTGWPVSAGFVLAGNLVLIPAFASAAAAFLGEVSDRATRLRRAASIAALGFALLMVGAAIEAGVYANADFATKLVAGDSLSATADLSAAIAATMASVAFRPSRSKPATRNWWLGLASIALGGAFLLIMAGSIVIVSGREIGTSALELNASGAGVGLVAAALAAIAFLLARRPQRETGEDCWWKRDGMLGIAQAVLAIAFLLTAIEDAITAGQSAGGKTIANAWLSFGSDLSLLVGAITASVGFFMVGRLRRR
jgi:hypothetical protein